MKRMRKMIVSIAAVLMITAFPTYGFAGTTAEAAEITKDVSFSGITAGEVIPSVMFSNDFFSDTSDNYNHDLAQFSSALCAAAGSGTQTNIEKAFASFDFVNDTVYDAKSYERNYEENPDVAGYAFANKKINQGGKTYTLVAVVVRSTREQEWYSNFNVNDRGTATVYHEGFYKAETELSANLKKYMAALGTDKQNTKLLITGHSRGAAIANILTEQLSESQELAYKENIYGYTFACPNTSAAEDRTYDNIFNIINPADFVTNLPLSSWNFHKSGELYALPCEKDKVYKELLPEASENFAELTGGKYTPLSVQSTETFFDDMYELAPTIEDCYSDAISYKGGSTTLKGYFDVLAGILAEGKGVTAFVRYSSGQLNNLTSYFITNQLLSNGIRDSHSIETYISWLAVTDEEILLQDTYTQAKADPEKSESECDFFRDCYASTKGEDTVKLI